MIACEIFYNSMYKDLELHLFFKNISHTIKPLLLSDVSKSHFFRSFFSTYIDYRDKWMEWKLYIMKAREILHLLVC